MARSRLVPGNFTLAIVTTVAVASAFPAQGVYARVFETLTVAAISLLFFMHGAKLSRAAVIAGVVHWRLHLLVLASTFVLFPVLGLGLRPLLSTLVTPELYQGIVFLCVLPATVQSAIVFTSLARGNVPAAICSASASTLLGVFITPLLVALVVGVRADTRSGSAIGAIVLQLMVPFVAGQLMRPLIGPWMDLHGGALKPVDEGSILLIVYTAFSAAVVEGLWHQVPAQALVGVVLICAVILTLALVITTWTSRRLRFNKADEITIVFCGSKKSLASGVPMAKVLFASHAVGAIVLPLMLFHQLQLMVCGVLAAQYARRAFQSPLAAAAPQVADLVD